MAEEQITQLLQNLTDKLSYSGFNSNLVSIFGGDSLKFKKWIIEIEKISFLHNLPNIKTKFLAYRFSEGLASDFIRRTLDENPDLNWADFKNILSNRFGEVSDTYIQFSALQNIRQTYSESIQDFADRIIGLVPEAYLGFINALDLIDMQIIGFFIDGLIDKNIQTHLIRENPSTFQNAVSLAVNEHNVKIRCKIRSDMRENPILEQKHVTVNSVGKSKMCSPGRKDRHDRYISHRQ